MSVNQEIINMPNVQSERISRAQGCLIGQLAGDALGSLVAFQSPEQIWQQYSYSK